MVSLLSDGGGSNSVLADEVVEATVENTEEEEGEENHDDKVTNENVISAVTHVLPHLRWTDRQFTLMQDPCGGVVVLAEGVVGHLGVVGFVAGDELIEPGDVPEEGGGNHGEDEEAAGISQGSKKKINLVNFLQSINLLSKMCNNPRLSKSKSKVSILHKLHN